MARKVWFRLVDSATRGAFVGHTPSSVLSDGVKDIEDLRNKIRSNYRSKEPDILAGVEANQLDIFATRVAYDEKDAEALDSRSLIGVRGASAEEAFVVVVPMQHVIPRAVPSLAAISIATVLNEPNKYAEECISLTEWAADTEHEIPSIWRFMGSLGGCTSIGEIFWRLEDEQVVSILVDGWFRKSTPGDMNSRANKKSILIRSPGIGKSTLLCLIAFYALFKHKKDVLVCRQLY